MRTEGRYDPTARIGDLHLPALEGKTVLDVGAWDGGYSFAVEQRGAARVLATDHWCWSGPGWGTREGFDLAHGALGSHVESLDIDPHDLTAESVGRFDVVLFLGVLYHLKDPLVVLERVHDVTGDLLILETEVDLLFSRRPVAAFYEGKEMAADEYELLGTQPGRRPGDAARGRLQRRARRRQALAAAHRRARRVPAVSRRRQPQARAAARSDGVPRPALSRSGV